MIEIGKSVDKLVFEAFYEKETGTEKFRIFKGKESQRYLVEDCGDTYLIVDTYQQPKENDT